MEITQKTENSSYDLTIEEKSIALISTSIGSNGEFNFNVSVTDPDLDHENSSEASNKIIELLKEVTKKTVSGIQASEA